MLYHIKRKFLPIFVMGNFLILTCLSFFSCSNATVKTEGIIAVDPTKEDKISIHHFFDKIELIPLETNKASIITNAEKIIQFKDLYYVLDVKQKAIIVFNEKGKFKFKIQNVGRGPEDYMSINDIVINHFDNTLEALSPQGQILKYDGYGKFLYSFNLPIKAVHYFMPVSKDIIALFSNYEKKRLSFYSRSSEKIIATIRDVPEFIARKTSLNPINSPFSAFGSHVFYFEPFSNNVYKVKENGIELSYMWDFGHFNLNLNELPINETAKELAAKIAKYAHNFMYNIENSKYVFTSFVFDKKWKNLIYDKKTGVAKVFSNFTEGVTWPTIQFYDSGIFTFVDPVYLNIVVNDKVLDGAEMKKMNAVKMQDNVVVLKYSFKKELMTDSAK